MRRGVVTGVTLPLAACLALVGGILGTGCTSESTGTSTSTDAALVPIDRDAAIAAAIDVRATGCGPRVTFGSGSVIDNGDIVTAAHVVAGAAAIEVIDIDGNTTAGRVVLFDPNLDLAVIRPDIAIGTPLPVRSLPARAGESGVVVLPRLGGDEVPTQVAIEVAEIQVVRHVNIATTDIYLQDDVFRDGYEIEASIDPGDSGAMVILPGGGAGIVWARSNEDSRRAWAIDLPADLVDLVAGEEPATPIDLGACRDDASR